MVTTKHQGPLPSQRHPSTSRLQNVQNNMPQQSSSNPQQQSAHTLNGGVVSTPHMQAQSHRHPQGPDVDGEGLESRLRNMILNNTATNVIHESISHETRQQQQNGDLQQTASHPPPVHPLPNNPTIAPLQYPPIPLTASHQAQVPVPQYGMHYQGQLPPQHHVPYQYQTGLHYDARIQSFAPVNGISAGYVPNSRSNARPQPPENERHFHGHGVARYQGYKRNNHQRYSGQSYPQQQLVISTEEFPPLGAEKPKPTSNQPATQLTSAYPTSGMVRTAMSGNGSNHSQPKFQSAYPNPAQKVTSGRQAPVHTSNYKPYRPSLQQMAILNDIVREQISLATMKPEEVEYKKRLHEKLQNLCHKVCPTGELKAFGSLVSGFATIGSDLDLVLVDSTARKGQPYFEIPLLLEKELNENGLETKLLAKTRVPILKITQPATEEYPYPVAADIGFANELALHNTNMLLTYSKCDPRVIDMVKFVKMWAKTRKINYPYKGTLSSYGYVLMVLHYLMNATNPPVLPNLQLWEVPVGTPQQELRTEDGHNIWYYKNHDKLKELCSQGKLTTNKEDVATLLLGFFEYYAYKFNWGKEVISLRTYGGLLTKAEKGWTSAIIKKGKEDTEYKDRYLFAIEDPFEITHNVSRTCNFWGVRQIKEEFKRANRLCRWREGELALRQRLFEPAPDDVRPPRTDGSGQKSDAQTENSGLTDTDKQSVLAESTSPRSATSETNSAQTHSKPASSDPAPLQMTSSDAGVSKVYPVQF